MTETKTKRQLRAEAVERLNLIPRGTLGLYPRAVSAAIGGDAERMTNGEVVDALVDLLTDDEPPEGDAVDILHRGGYLGLDAVHGAVCEATDTYALMFSRLADMVERDYVRADDYDDLALLRARAERERDGWRRRAEGSGKQLCASQSAENVPQAGLSATDGAQDARERLDTLEQAYKGTSQACFDAQTECERLQGKVDELTAERERQLPEGVAWPRFEDGALVRFGDEYAGFRHPIDELHFARNSFALSNVDCENATLCYGTPVKRPPLLAADGEPIEAGQVLYGEDGRAWEVTGLNRGKPHPVEAIEGNVALVEAKSRDLKPEWLTHEPPDSLERVAEDLRDIASHGLHAANAGELDGLAERIERLAGGAG